MTWPYRVLWKRTGYPFRNRRAFLHLSSALFCAQRLASWGQPLDYVRVIDVRDHSVKWEV